MSKENLNKNNNFFFESNNLTGSNFENINKEKVEDLNFNLNLKLRKLSKENDLQKENPIDNNADITFENSKAIYLNNFDSFNNNNIQNNSLLSNQKYANGDYPNFLTNSEKCLIFNSHQKFLNEDNKNQENDLLENNKEFLFLNDYNNKLNLSPEKINLVNELIFKKLVSSCKHKKGKLIDISESERKFNLELIDNMNFDPNDRLLLNDSIIISNFNELENKPLDNKWEKILKEIEESHRMDDTDPNISILSYANENNCKDIIKFNDTSLQNNINNSNVWVNFDPLNHSLQSYYDIHLDKEEFEKFVTLETKEKKFWLKKYKKEVYDFIINNNFSNNEAKKSNIKDLIKSKKSSTKKNNLLNLRKRKSLLEIHYCHITFEDDETYEGESLQENSTNINGYGVYKYKNGDIYEGDFVDGKRDGLGEYIYKDKSYYRGEWKDDNKTGRGVYCKNEKEYNGIWKENNFISGLIFEIKNLNVEEIEVKGNSLSLSNNKENINNSAEDETSNFSIEEEFLDLQLITDFKEIENERFNSNISDTEISYKYKVIQKDYLSNILMTNFSFLNSLKVNTEIYLNDIIFNQKSIFKKFFNYNSSDNCSKPDINYSNKSQNELTFSFADQDSIEKLNIEELIFYSDCPIEETLYEFNKSFNLSFNIKCDCKKIRNFISQFC